MTSMALKKPRNEIIGSLYNPASLLKSSVYLRFPKVAVTATEDLRPVFLTYSAGSCVEDV